MPNTITDDSLRAPATSALVRHRIWIYAALLLLAIALLLVDERMGSAANPAATSAPAATAR